MKPLNAPPPFTKQEGASTTYRVGVVQWFENDGIGEAIFDELLALGHEPVYFRWDRPLPRDVEVIFSFAPYGDFLRVASRLEEWPPHQRPPLIHWNTEGIPDLGLPWPFVSTMSTLRSGVGRAIHASSHWLPASISRVLHKWQTSCMLRFRYVGDYYYAYRRGWLHIFADSSEVYAHIHRQHGLPTFYFPWGAVPRWYGDLRLQRDVDVLWMGKRGTKRRSDMLDRVRAELRGHGIEIYVADNEENPYVFGDERTALLNRAKITLNITRTWYDDNFSRFSMAASNRSLIVSEPMLPHCPEYKAGVHYVSAPIDKLAESIVYYIKNEDKRAEIVENAYHLVTTQLTMRNSLKPIMEEVDKIRQAAQAGPGTDDQTRPLPSAKTRRSKKVTR
jgi:hypothetical protein